MYEYIKGIVTEISPAHLVIETNGVGYFMHISLNAYSLIGSKKDIKIFVHQIIREDSNSFYGFFDKPERDLFRKLISVSGVGANIARMMLSTMSPAEIVNAILLDDVNTLKSIKGIGPKSAQRIIIELKDKLNKSEAITEIIVTKHNRNSDEALSALVMLGFEKNQSSKILNKFSSKEPELTVEELVKRALKEL
ncbi:MAG: Holliday junction branch migration protein RuvA [Bacteroidales bacterium]|nr:Holliday junction branch migration protein RuvA [Bacteroidales bacterium]